MKQEHMSGKSTKRVCDTGNRWWWGHEIHLEDSNCENRSFWKKGIGEEEDERCRAERDRRFLML